jgi:hypothetical protein
MHWRAWLYSAAIIKAVTAVKGAEITPDKVRA